MRTLAATLAVGAGIILAHLIPALIMAAMPEWMQTALVLFVFGVLPVWGFIKVAKWARP